MLLSIHEACREMWNWIVQYTGGFPVLPLLSIAAGIYLLAANKAFMRKLLAPIIALVVIVFNPILYSLLYANNNLPFVTSYGLRYWRFFWLLPQGILIGAAAAELMRRFSSPLARCLGLSVAAALILMAGQNIFMDERVFKPSTSAYKLRPTVQAVCEKVLADDPEPLCMFDSVISTEAREYSGSIRQLWGRSGVWNILPDPEALEVYNQLTGRPRDLEAIFAFAEQRGVTHISFVVRAKEDWDEMLTAARRHGYEELDRIDKRIILHRSGLVA
jgi:hypothetical protein